MKRVLGTLIALLGIATSVCAQADVPILSGALAFNSSTTGGATTFQPTLAPVLVAPIGDHWLFEGRAQLLGFFFQQNGTSGPYNGQFFATLDYAQIDYIANPHLTISVGRFLTPFNIYNERFSAVWIANLQDSPLIFTIGTRSSSASMGGWMSSSSRRRRITNSTTSWIPGPTFPDRIFAFRRSTPAPVHAPSRRPSSIRSRGSAVSPGTAGTFGRVGTTTGGSPICIERQLQTLAECFESMRENPWFHF